MDFTQILSDIREQGNVDTLQKRKEYVNLKKEKLLTSTIFRDGEIQ